MLDYLLKNVGCIGLFSTHYGGLCKEFHRVDMGVKRMYMDFCTNGDEYDLLGCSNCIRRRVTFLYKLVEGVCEESYGMNVASMCGINISVVVSSVRTYL